jgi:hypothetical protein
VDGRRLRDILCNGRVAPLMGMRFPARMLVFIAGVDESLMADEEVASSKGLCANVANERFLFGMGTDVSLEMFLCACRSVRQARSRGREGSHQPGKEALAMRTWQSLCFGA